MTLFGKAKKTQENKSVGKFDGRIALFGCRAAGKTVYVGSLYDAYNARESGLQVNFDGERSGVYLAELQKSILKHPRRWPAPTVVENEVRLKLELESALAASSPTVNLQLFDPPGEWLALGGAEQAAPDRQEGAKAMRDFVAEADGIFFFFEPDNFAFQVLRDKIKRALPELQDWAQKVDKRLDDLIAALKTTESEILAQLQSENFLLPLVEKDDQEEMVREVEGILDSEENIDSLLKGLFRDAELKYLLRKYELNVEPILANAQELSQTRTPSGKPVDVLFRIIELIQESAASEDRDTELLQNIESYFRVESNNRLMAAVTRLQEIQKKAELESNAADRSIALIIAKADELDVFRQSPERPYVLIPPKLEHLKFKSGDDRLDNLRKALEDYWEKQDTRWRSIINQLFTGPFKSLFLKLMSFPGDFQIFFVSSVGEVERDKSGFVQPPQGENDFKPKGVDQPVLWTARQIYSHAMVHRASRRLLRGALFPLVLLLIPAALFIYNIIFQSAVEGENDPALQVAAKQHYEQLVSLPMPAKNALIARIDLLNLKQQWEAYQQTLSRKDKTPEEVLKQAAAQLEPLKQAGASLLDKVAQHQVALRPDAEHLVKALAQEQSRINLSAVDLAVTKIRNKYLRPQGWFSPEWNADEKTAGENIDTLRQMEEEVKKWQGKLAETQKRLNPEIVPFYAKIQNGLEQLMRSIRVEYTHLIAWRAYKGLHNKLSNEIELIGSREEIAGLLSEAEGVDNQIKTADGGVISHLMVETQGKARALQKMQKAISSAIDSLKDYQENGVKMKFGFSNPLAINLSVPLADGREHTVQKGDEFRWLPTLPLPMVLIPNAGNIELPAAPLMEPGDFKKEIGIKVAGENQTLNLIDTWFSYASALESVLVPYDGAWIH
jgi:hypothetical protein